MHVFVRHPPLPDLQGVCYGRLDAALPVSVFEQAAQALVAQLPGWPIVSSPSMRCLGLAQALQAARDALPGGCRDAPAPAAVRIDTRLQELDFGAWEGQRWEALPREALDDWSRDVAGFAAPDGESFNALIARVRIAIGQLATPHVVVTHAGVIRAALHASGMPLRQAASATVAYLQPVWVDTADA